MTDSIIEIRDQNISGDVEVDGRTFINCRIDNVRLRYAGGALPVFENCQATAITWYFQGAALRTIQLLQMQNLEGAAQDMIDGLFNSRTFWSNSDLSIPPPIRHVSPGKGTCG